MSFDCRLHHIHGYEQHKSWCDSRLAEIDLDSNCAIIVATDYSHLLYCQYNFKYEASDEFHLKMLQPAGYLIHAWKIFETSHSLATIFASDSSVFDKVKSMVDASSVKAKVVNLAAAVPEALTASIMPTAAAKESTGVISWLKRFVTGAPQDWLSALENRLQRYAKDDLVDPSLLPDSRAALRGKLLREMHSWLHEETEGFEGASRVSKAYLDLKKYHPLAGFAKYLEARATIIDPSLDHFHAWMDVAEGIAATKRLHVASYFVLLNMDAERLELYLLAEEGANFWRPLSEDPNYLVRYLLCKSEVLPLKGMGFGRMTDVYHELNIEVGRWHIENENYDDARDIFTSVVRDAGSLPAEKVQMLRIKAREYLCQIATLEDQHDEVLDLARLQQEELDSSTRTDCMVQEAEYSLRNFYWRIHATCCLTDTLDEVLFAQAYLLAASPKVELVSASTVACRVAEIIELEARVALATGDRTRGLACYEKAIACVKKHTELKIDDTPVVTAFKPFRMIIELNIDLCLLRIEEEDFDAALLAMGDAFEAIATLANNEYYRSAKDYFESLPGLPEKKIFEAATKLDEIFKAFSQSESPEA